MKRFLTPVLFTTLGLTGCASLLPPELQTSAPNRPAPTASEASQCADYVRLAEKSPVVKPGSHSVDALFWCNKAAEKGDVKSQLALAGMYERGIGLPVSQADALRWYKAAANQGDAGAQFKVGQMYGRGQGVAQDKNEATRWYLKAAEQGLPEAQYYMGYRYEHGKGAAQSYPEAARWYTKAAEQGNVSAMNGLGGLNLAGHGLPQNQLEAYKWFNLAAVSGEREFIANRDKAAANLTPAQLAEGQRLASDWARTHTIDKAATR